MTDTGCDSATQYLGYQSSCFRCPFKECIYDLKPMEKNMILLSDTIREVFDLIDCGKQRSYVIALYNHIPIHTINNWLNKRKRVEEKLSRYGTVEKTACSMSTL